MKSYIACSSFAPQIGGVFHGVRMDFDRKGKQMFTKIWSSSKVLNVSMYTEDVYFVKTEGSYYLLIVDSQNDIQYLPIFGYAKKVKVGKRIKLEQVDWDSGTDRMVKTNTVVVTNTIKEIIKYGDNVRILISYSNKVYYAMIK